MKWRIDVIKNETYWINRETEERRQNFWRNIVLIFKFCVVQTPALTTFFLFWILLTKHSCAYLCAV